MYYYMLIQRYCQYRLCPERRKILKFLRYFMHNWYGFPTFKWFCESRGLKWKGKNPKEQYRNRFDYAWKNAKIQYAHRDMYSKRCTGMCETCKLKHC